MKTATLFIMLCGIGLFAAPGGLLSSFPALAQPTFEPPVASVRASTQQYVYVLKLVPRLRTPDNWTPADNDIVGEHFQRLERLTQEGTVLLAGRTQGTSADDFGIVIFEAVSETDAHAFMQADPAVAEGLMTAQLFPYRVALMHQRHAPEL